MAPSLAELIRSGRIRKGWNQSELAEKAGVSRTTLVQLERGTVQEPHPTTLKKVGELLDIPPEALVIARTGERAVPAPSEVIYEPAHFDRATNPAVAVMREIGGTISATHLSRTGYVGQSVWCRRGAHLGGSVGITGAAGSGSSDDGSIADRAANPPARRGPCRW